MTTAVTSDVKTSVEYQGQFFIGARAEAIKAWEDLAEPALRDELMERLTARFEEPTEQATLLVNTLYKANANDRLVLLRTILAFTGTLEMVTNPDLSGRPLTKEQYERCASQLYSELKLLIDQHAAGQLSLQCAAEGLDSQYVRCFECLEGLLQQVTLIAMVLRSHLTPFRSPVALPSITASEEHFKTLVERLRPIVDELERSINTSKNAAEALVALITSFDSVELSVEERAVVFVVSDEAGDASRPGAAHHPLFRSHGWRGAEGQPAAPQ